MLYCNVIIFPFHQHWTAWGVWAFYQSNYLYQAFTVLTVCDYICSCLWSHHLQCTKTAHFMQSKEKGIKQNFIIQMTLFRFKLSCQIKRKHSKYGVNFLLPDYALEYLPKFSKINQWYFFSPKGKYDLNTVSPM